jgi:SAM-dependent methyltransferase
MKDLFSTQAATYAQFRPEYPQRLYDFILEHTAGRGRAWDCGTGNGQAAKVLCQHFDQVMATDISQKQLDAAHQAPNIHYSLQPAETTHFEEASFDLVTVAQALHWFKFEDFFRELRRVAKPGATFAAWGYETLHFDHDEIDRLMQNFYRHTTEPYWEPERQHIEDRYAKVPFPFERLDCPNFSISLKWHRHEFEGYLNSWSAVQKCIRTEGHNPVPSLMLDISPYWGEFERQICTFPVFMVLGKM